MEHKITILDGHALNPGDLSYDVFKQFGTLTTYERTEAEKVIERIADSDIILLNKVCITKDIIKACPNLKYIGVFATGYNVIDLKAAKDAGIIVTNIPSYSTNAVAQQVFAFILQFANQISLHSNDVMNGGWCKSKDFCYTLSPLTELEGKKIGIIGYGNIGSRVAEIAKAFGMKVVTAHNSERAKKDCIDIVGLEGMKSCDYITLHMPLTKENTHIVNKDFIENFCNKKTILINTARGGLIDETAVATALKTGSISGYAADVVETEPMKKDNPLINAPNCFITPHIAWAPLETRQRLLDIAVNNLKAYLDGNPVNSVIN